MQTCILNDIYGGTKIVFLINRAQRKKERIFLIRVGDA